jgi:RpiR family transcriptional regulator, carbohydrate utilization regulator
MIISAIEAHLETLRPSERAVADFVLGRPTVVVTMSIADLAEQCQVSEPTIMRFCKAIGCLGFMELKLGLARDLERRTFMMNRANAAVKGPTGFGQALFQRALETVESFGHVMGLDRLDDVLEWCAASRAISIVHDGTEGQFANTLVDALLACKLEAKAWATLPSQVRLDGRLVVLLRSAAGLAGAGVFCQSVLDQGGKVAALGCSLTPSNVAFHLDPTQTNSALQAELAYLALLETVRSGIQARLSRTGVMSDAAQDFLQSHREIAYGDARRRDRQSAQAQSADTQMPAKKEPV